MIQKIKEIIVDAVFPHICLCGKWGGVLCEDCFGKIPKNKKELCPLCQCLSENGQSCKRCRSKSQLTGVMVFGKHEGVLKDAIWKYKYELIKDFNQPLSDLLLLKYSKFLENKNFIITNVPISKTRKRWRGYNQAELIARAVAKQKQCEYASLLEKEGTLAQVGLKRKERIKNIQGKIKSVGNYGIKNKKILIIDDVYTTGSTLEECAKVLRKAGAREVWGMVLSRD